MNLDVLVVWRSFIDSVVGSYGGHDLSVFHVRSSSGIVIYSLPWGDLSFYVICVFLIVYISTLSLHLFADLWEVS